MLPDVHFFWRLQEKKMFSFFFLLLETPHIPWLLTPFLYLHSLQLGIPLTLLPLLCLFLLSSLLLLSFVFKDHCDYTVPS